MYDRRTVRRDERGRLLRYSHSGTSGEVTIQAFSRSNEGMRILNTQGLVSMGFRISANVGACLASGRQTDGLRGRGQQNSLMNIQELKTIAKINPPHQNSSS